MVSIVSTVAYLGLEARSVEVQCQIAPGMVGFAVVGLPDKAVAESRERVRAAISALGLALPPKRITINLSPADLPKEGSHYDLPIALALLGAMGLADAEALAQYVVVGELGLDGRVAASPGVLLAALHASSRQMGLICPAAQGSEAAWAGQIEVVAAPDLLALLNHLKGQMVGWVATILRSRPSRRSKIGTWWRSKRAEISTSCSSLRSMRFLRLQAR